MASNVDPVNAEHGPPHRNDRGNAQQAAALMPMGRGSYYQLTIENPTVNLGIVGARSLLSWIG